MIGRTFLHYRILERLGQGGMGEVYVAEDTRLARKVAVKFLRDGPAIDPQRFEHEARTLAALNHPNIVTLFAVEEDQGERFLVMEWVAGLEFQKVIPQGGMNAADFRTYALQLIDAVATAHEQGILHRDLKPSNIMVTSEGRLKVLDFGLAEDLAPEPLPETSDPITATRVRTVPGTVAYMAPELLEGKAADARSDLFSLGVILFEMATGQRPFAGESTMELMMSIVQNSAPSVRKFNANLPAAVTDLIALCLEKKAEDRISSVAVLRDELVRVFPGSESSTTLTAPSLSTLALQRHHRHRRWLWWAVPIVLALMATVWGYRSLMLHQAPTSAEATQRKMVVVLPFENLGAPGDEFFAAGVTEEITSRLAAISGLGVISRTSAVQYADSNKNLQQIGQELGVDFVLEGTVRWDRSESGPNRVRVTPQLIQVADDTHLWSERYDRVLEDIFEVQSEIAQRVTAQLGVTLFPAERQAIGNQPTGNMDAYQAYLMALEYRRAPYEAAPVLRAIEQLDGATSHDPAFALAYAEMAQAHSILHHFGHDRSVRREQLARAAVERAIVLAPDSPETHLANGYFLYWTQKDYPAALEALAKAADGLPNDTRVLEAQGYIQRRLGRMEDALGPLRRALELDPRSGSIERELAGTLMFTGRYDEANVHFDRAIELLGLPTQAILSKVRNLWLAGDLSAARTTLESLPPTDDRQASWSWFWQLAYEGRYEEALAQAEAMDDEFLNWTIRAFPFSLLVGQANDLLGRPAAAHIAYEKARSRIEDELRKNPEDARLFGSLGLALAGLDLDDAAITAGRRSTELLPIARDAIFGAYRRVELAMIYTRVGRHEEAIDELSYLLTVPSQISPARLRIDPLWQPLRQHPRYPHLLQDL